MYNNNQEEGNNADRENKEKAMKADYEQRVSDFNQASNSSYIADIHFLRFRKTTKGMKVDYSLGKNHEINKLRQDVEKAGHPYYCTF